MWGDAERWEEEKQQGPEGVVSVTGPRPLPGTGQGLSPASFSPLAQPVQGGRGPDPDVRKDSDSSPSSLHVERLLGGAVHLSGPQCMRP